MKEQYLLSTDKATSSELHEGTVTSALARATEILREKCMAKWVEVVYIRPAHTTWHKAMDEQEFVARIPQSD